MEIERKFLMKPELLNLKEMGGAIVKKIEIEQYYIPKKDKEARIRKASTASEVIFFYTEKKGKGLIREEKEKEISKKDFLNIKKKAVSVIKKTRLVLKNGIEIDVYPNKDYIVLEKEFKTIRESKEWILPFSDLCILEATGREEYSNKNLSTPIHLFSE